MKEHILIAEDDADLAFFLQEALKREAYKVEVEGTAEKALQQLGQRSYDLFLLDVKLPDGDGVDLLSSCRELAPDVPVILMTAHSTRQMAIEATNQGAYDFFSKPFQLQEVQVVIRRALERKNLLSELKALRKARQREGLGEIIGESPALRRVLTVARQVAPTELAVLIEGESGTGKELLAKAIHQQGLRRGGPFIVVNCAAIPEGLLESELFGHERGAFTGAYRARIGKFELARGGTVFLDEIGDMSVSMQAKLLRVIQEKTFYRVGGERPATTDARILAATNREVDRLVLQGKFREDLAYRLQGVRLFLPPLRERLEDLPLLIERAFPWPGNIRQLQHVLDGALVIAENGVVRPEHLPPALQETKSLTLNSNSLDEILAGKEREVILEALKKANGVQAKAAKLLGISERSSWYRIKKLGIVPKVISTED
jgi:DNA-binding NtrC family response regulator